MYGFINVQKREGIVLATIFESRSAEWKQELVGEMCCFIEQIRDDPTVQVVIFNRIKQEDLYRSGMTASAGVSAGSMERLFDDMERMKPVTIAVIDGVVAGSCLGFFMACNFRVAAEAARLDFSFENGALPLQSEIRRVETLTGAMRARELFLTGGIICAGTAMQFSLINKTAEPERLMAESIELAKRIRMKDPDLIDRVSSTLK